MIYSAILTKRERKVIKKATLIELNALYDIRDNNCENLDVISYYLKYGLVPDDMLVYNNEKIKRFENVLKNPSTFLSLDRDLLGLYRHILVNYIDNPKLKEAKITIWRKMNIKEDFLYSPQ